MENAGAIFYADHLFRRGTVSVNGTALKSGDALKLTRETQITLDQAEAAEVLVFDLPY